MQRRDGLEIASLRTDLVQQISGVNSNINDVKTEITAVNETVASLKLSLDTLKTEYDGLKKKCEDLSQENEELKNDLYDLRGEFADMQQYSRRDNIEIVGVPYKQRENLHDIAAKIASFYNISSYRSSDISIIHRLQDSKRTGKPNIVMKFVRREAKEKWITTARMSKTQLTAADLNEGWTMDHIYMNDHLTYYNKGLLSQLRGMLREKKIARVWTRDCRLLVRVKEDSPTRQVRTTEDVHQLLKK